MFLCVCVLMMCDVAGGVVSSHDAVLSPEANIPQSVIKIHIDFGRPYTYIQQPLYCLFIALGLLYRWNEMDVATLYFDDEFLCRCLIAICTVLMNRHHYMSILFLCIINKL